MARRKAAPSPIASVTWRDGVHLTDTPIWCDARRRRDVCFVSSADRVGRTGHGQLIASPLTLALLGATGGGHLGVPLHRKFTLGTVRLELITSGRGPGAAALHVDIAGKTVLYAGTIRTQSASTIEGAEARKCDVLVVGAPLVDRKQPALSTSIDKTIDTVSRELAAGRRPVIAVETALDGLEVALVLAHAGISLAASRPIRDTVQRAAALATEALEAARVRAARDAELRGSKRAPTDGEARTGKRKSNGDSRKGASELHIAAPGKDSRATIILARDDAGRAKLGPHVLVPAWPNVAGREDLLGWIESIGAREVYVTGEAAEDIARAIGAKVLGPPQQLALFEARA